MERVKGEAVLFLGPKSKHTQFGKMCLDPKNEKFKVEKEEDLQVNTNMTNIYIMFFSVHKFFPKYSFRPFGMQWYCHQSNTFVNEWIG